MTVAELIAKLQEMPHDLPVGTACEGAGYPLINVIVWTTRTTGDWIPTDSVPKGTLMVDLDFGEEIYRGKE